MLKPFRNGRDHDRRAEHARSDRDARHDRNDRRDRPARPDREDRKPSRSGMSALQAVRFAKAQLLELTGKRPESVSSVNRTRDGWVVNVEVVELERIPQSTDILASYQVELDERGELRCYERVNRYYRNQTSGEE